MRVELHIERLVLEGVSPTDRHAVASALERELGRLIRTRGLPAALRRSGHLRSVTAELPERRRSASGATTGTAVARSVYGGLES